MLTLIECPKQLTITNQFHQSTCTATVCGPFSLAFVILELNCPANISALLVALNKNKCLPILVLTNGRNICVGLM